MVSEALKEATLAQLEADADCETAYAALRRAQEDVKNAHKKQRIVFANVQEARGLVRRGASCTCDQQATDPNVPHTRSLGSLG